MTAPSDTIIQHIAQSMTPTHWSYVLGVIFAALIVSLVVCLVGVWREVRRGDQQLQRDLHRSESRARSTRHERS